MGHSASRVVLVTGAAQGIGRELAGRFVRAGDTVFGLDVNADALDATGKSLSQEGAFTTLSADVSDRGAVDAAMTDVSSRAGRLDVLVNNAAVVLARPFEELTQDVWASVIGVNLTGVFNCVQSALPLMGEGGRIVTLSSHSGSLGSRDRAAYAASKGGVNALTRVLAVELAERGITVNAVAPGPVDTPHAREHHSGERRMAWEERLAIKRYGSESEIAAAVMFLASPDASYITGQILPVDGGMSAAGIISTG